MVVLPGKAIMPCQMHVQYGIDRCELDSPFTVRQRFLCPTHRQQVMRVKMMRSYRIRVQLDGSLEFAFSPDPVPIVVNLGIAERRVNFRKSVVYRQGLFSCSSGLRESFFGRQYFAFPGSHNLVNISQSGVTKGILRVFGDGFLKIHFALLQIIFSAFIQEVATPEIGLMSLRIDLVYILEKKFLL